MGYFKSGVLTGDTAIIVLQFSTGGNQFSELVYEFTGNQNTWQKFSFPISLSQTPDSAFFAAASSNALNEIGIQSGSWLMLDSIAFAGSGITQTIPNFDFENWTADSIVIIDDWLMSESVIRTTDNQEGSFALKLETMAFGQDTSFITTNGQIGNGAVMGGHPYTITLDTLVGFYKYLPVGSDTAAMSLNFVKNGAVINSEFKVFGAQSSYTTFEIPFNLGQAPDSMFVVLASSAFQRRVVGSALFIDDLKLKSVVTSLNKEIEVLGEMTIYPNPTQNNVNLQFQPLKQKMNIQIIDQLGRLFGEKVVGVGESIAELDMESLNSGIYYLRIIVGEELIHRQIIKK